MSPVKIWKWPFDKNRLSEEAVLLTVKCTHEYSKLWDGQPPWTNGSCQKAIFKFWLGTFIFDHPLIPPCSLDTWHKLALEWVWHPPGRTTSRRCTPGRHWPRWHISGCPRRRLPTVSRTRTRRRRREGPGCRSGRSSAARRGCGRINRPRSRRCQ